MQNTRSEWKPLVKRLFTRKSLINYDLGQEIVRKLGYKDLYSPQTTILDAYSGLSVFSAALHNEMKPKSHILMEPFPSYTKLLAQLADPPRVWYELEDPYRWSTFQHLVEKGKFKPVVQPRSQVHNELLFTANLLHPQGEQLVTQYLNCISNQSWILRYGRVRLLLWMRSRTAEKLMAGPGEKYRHRVACQRESSCDARVIVHTPPEKLPQGYPAALQNPLVTGLSPSKDFAGLYVPDLSLVELTPHERQVEHIDEFEYLIKMLFVLKSTPLKQSLNSLGPGAVDDLSPQLADLLHIKPVDLTADQLLRITDTFWRWPFKPDVLMDFYEEKSLGMGNLEDA